MSSNGITSQLSTEDNDETKDLEPQLNVLSKNMDSVLDQRPSFCLSEEQRKLKSFQERKCDVDQAIQWIVKEIVSIGLVFPVTPLLQTATNSRNLTQNSLAKIWTIDQRMYQHVIKVALIAII